MNYNNNNLHQASVPKSRIGRTQLVYSWRMCWELSPQWMSSAVKGYRKDEKLAKVIAHGVPAYAFGEDMKALHQEITNYNNNIQLTAPPRWLTKKLLLL